MSTDFLQSLPRWALVLLSGGCVLAVGAIGTSAGMKLSESTQTNHQQDRRLDNHETRLNSVERLFERMDGKIDRLLERVPAK